jgi:Protein of unknown function (DUF1559)
MKTWFWATVGVAVLMVAGLVVSMTGSSVPSVAAHESTPGPLMHVPVEGLGLLSIDVAKLHDSGMLKPLREALAKGDQAFLKRIEKDYGFTLAELERITLYQPNPDAGTASMFLGIGGGAGFAGMPLPNGVNLGTGGGGHSVFNGSISFVTTRKPMDTTKFLKAWKAKASTDPTHQNGVIGQAGNIGFAGGGVRLALPNAGAVEVFPASAPKAEEKKDEKDKPKETPLDLEAPYFVAGQYSDHIIVLIDDRNFVVMPSGSDSMALVSTLLRKRKTGPLSEAFSLAEKHAVVGLVDGKQFKQMVAQHRQMMQAQSEQPQFDNDGNQIPAKPKDPNEKVMDQFTPYEPLFPMTNAILTIDLDAKLEAKLKIKFPKAEEATKALPAAKGMMQDLGDLFTAQRKSTLTDPDDAVLVPYYDFALSTVKGAKTEQDGSTITINASPVVDAKIVDGFATLPAKLMELTDRQQTMNNMIAIGTAFNQYVASHNSYPNDIQDENGKAILSWRVELLQFMGDEGMAVFNKIDRAKPWDHAVNKKLWDEMPEAFRIVARPAKEKHETFLQSFHTINWIGNDDPWLVLTKAVMPSDVTDGTTNTVMVCEMETATNWMKPDTTLLDVKKMPMIGDPKTGKAYAIFLDTNVRRLDRKKYSGDKLKAIITANGGEPVDLDE